jgi:dTDP-4-dehydrorhamnose 3,5-epimerase-like enzyme
MSNKSEDLWIGLNNEGRRSLIQRDYGNGSLAERISGSGVSAAELCALDRRSPEAQEVWIPGVEVFKRVVHHQRQRGLFGELARAEEGLLGSIGLWPKQWATARMFSNTAKGFHIHPPNIPAGVTAAEWYQQLFLREPMNCQLRRYDLEQWDVMFFVQGRLEMVLRDVRDGLPSRIMRFYIDGDNHPGPANVGVVIPPGVAHGLRVEGSEDALMVYGTTTRFHPEFEGRIASEVESAELPESWRGFLNAK